MRIGQGTIEVVLGHILSEKTRRASTGSDRVEQPLSGLIDESVCKIDRRSQIAVCGNDRIGPLAESERGAAFILTEIVKAITAANNPLLSDPPGETGSRLEIVPIRKECPSRSSIQTCETRNTP